MIHLRTISFVIGILLAILAGAMLLPALADGVAGHADWHVFIGSSGVTLFIGVSLILAGRPDRVRFGLRDAFALTTLSWIIVCAFAALPFHFAELDLRYADAYFEAMSGLTTTGSTVIAGLDKVQPGILLWRGLLHWMGGIGIIAIAIAILPLLKIGGMQLFRVESSDKSEKAMPRAREIAAGIAIVYVALTVLCAFGYWLFGMSAFDAVVHAMGTLSTGGFGNWDNSFGYFDSVAIEAVGIVFMAIGGMTFTLFLRMPREGWRPLVVDPQTRAYFGTIAVFTLVIAAWQVQVNGADPWLALRHAAFNVVSVITTTGYVSADYSTWGALPVASFFVLTFVGGCSGSTAGAIKIFRFQVLAALAVSHVRHTLSPSGVFLPKYNDRHLTESVTQSVLAFFFLYIMSFAALSVALGLTGLDLVTATSGAATALGNVGPGLGEIIGPAGNFAPLSDAAKWLLSLGMLLGRLELLTVIVMFTPAFWRP